MYFLEERLQIDAKNLNFEIFENTLNMKSGSMPLIHRASKVMFTSNECFVMFACYLPPWSNTG